MLAIRVHMHALVYPVLLELGSVNRGESHVPLLLMMTTVESVY